MLFTINVIIFASTCSNTIAKSVSTVDTDGLVLQHQGISNHGAEYTTMHFQMFMS